MAIRLMTSGGKLLIRGGKLLVHRDGQTNRPCCCPGDDDPPPVDPVPCSECATGTTPAFVELQIDDMGNGSCDCAGFFGTFVLPQEPGTPCNWNLDVGLPCGYNRVVASALGFGGFVTTYTVEVANLTNGHKIVFSKNVFGDGNNDCMTHWNNGGWFVTDSMAGDCDPATPGISYQISAYN